MHVIFHSRTKAMQCEPFHLGIVSKPQLSTKAILADFSAVNQLFCCVQKLGHNQ